MGLPQKFIVGVIAIIVREDRRILALHRTAGTALAAIVWECVSGKVELDEDPFQAVVREIREETGVQAEVDPRPLASWQTHRNYEPMVLIFYKADYLTGDVTLSKEHNQYDWLTPAEFAARTCYPRLAALIHEMMDEPGR